MNAEVLSVQAQVQSSSLMAGSGPTTASVRLQRPPAARFPAVAAAARRVLALMVNSFEEPPSITRLALQSGLSKRTLHRVVRREFGLSPMALSRRMRLSEVQAELRSPGPSTTVTGAAFRWGFTHLGRFAGEYAREFGERPSETLRFARRERGRDRRLPA
jgi:transcriptional regulator GlxA family with amidase domain